MTEDVPDNLTKVLLLWAELTSPPSGVEDFWATFQLFLPPSQRFMSEFLWLFLCLQNFHYCLLAGKEHYRNCTQSAQQTHWMSVSASRNSFRTSAWIPSDAPQATVKLCWSGLGQTELYDQGPGSVPVRSGQIYWKESCCVGNWSSEVHFTVLLKLGWF